MIEVILKYYLSVGLGFFLVLGIIYNPKSVIAAPGKIQAGPGQAYCGKYPLGPASGTACGYGR